MIEKFVDDLSPTVLVYLAVDGPAPRAKSNQQRARRFTSAAQKANSHAGGTWRSDDLLAPGVCVRYLDDWAEVVSVEAEDRRETIS